ncbi:hypothetical protein MIR68_004319 [Amoeboaphelidium protococcarum]|nr:hypothetical protein MIR68_004319 [Amoeboaphelidium protococcarum]
MVDQRQVNNLTLLSSNLTELSLEQLQSDEVLKSIGSIADEIKGMAQMHYDDAVDFQCDEGAPDQQMLDALLHCHLRAMKEYSKNQAGVQAILKESLRGLVNACSIIKESRLVSQIKPLLKQFNYVNLLKNDALWKFAITFLFNLLTRNCQQEDLSLLIEQYGLIYVVLQWLNAADNVEKLQWVNQLTPLIIEDVQVQKQLLQSDFLSVIVNALQKDTLSDQVRLELCNVLVESSKQDMVQVNLYGKGYIKQLNSFLIDVPDLELQLKTQICKVFTLVSGNDVLIEKLYQEGFAQSWLTLAFNCPSLPQSFLLLAIGNICRKATICTDLVRNSSIMTLVVQSVVSDDFNLKSSALSVLKNLAVTADIRKELAEYDDMKLNLTTLLDNPTSVVQTQVLVIIKLLSSNGDLLTLCSDIILIKKILSLSVNSDEDSVKYEGIRIVSRLLTNGTRDSVRQLCERITSDSDVMALWEQAVTILVKSKYEILRQEGLLSLSKFIETCRGESLSFTFGQDQQAQTSLGDTLQDLAQNDPKDSTKVLAQFCSENIVQ